MGFFKKLKDNYSIEFKEKPQNSVMWKYQYQQNHYRFLVNYLNETRPVQLTIEEVIELYYDLIEYQKTFPEPKGTVTLDNNPRYYELRWSNNSKQMLKEYPWLFLDWVIDELGPAIESGYALDYKSKVKYKITDDRKIQKFNSKPCNGCGDYRELKQHNLCYECARED